MKSLFTLLALLGVAAALNAAPAPLPKKPVPVNVVGVYEWRYDKEQTASYMVAVNNDGTTHTWQWPPDNNGNSTHYVGKWKLDGKRLTVDEVIQNNPDSKWSATYEFVTDKKGRITDAKAVICSGQPNCTMKRIGK